jgi:ribonuclease P/MRP protein subunit POP3
MSDFCSLVGPIGEHRKTHILPSKGRKRKRATNAAPDEPPKLPAPATASHVLVGLNSVTRHLETQAASTAPPTAPINGTSIDEQDNPTQTDQRESATPPRILSIVILTHPQPSLSPSHAHIPTLLHLANLRLVCLATSNDARLANTLHIPRVGAIGILEGAPGAKDLEEYVRKHVGSTECAWVDEALRSEWRGLNVQQG